MVKLGRPIVMSAEDRRKEIFQIAEKLFGEQGFENTTMSQIAVAAGMSKKTLYVIFSDKRELLKSLVSSSYILQTDPIETKYADPLEHVKDVLNSIAAHVLSDRHIKLCRLAIAERLAIEGITDTFYEMGIATSRNYLVRSLESLNLAQFKLKLDHETMADLLFGATIAKPFIDLLFIDKQVDLKEIQLKIEQVLESCFDKDVAENLV